jgi:ABC-type transporter Mla subunit MlaD
MNNDITEFLTSLQAEHDRVAARAEDLRRQIEHLATALGEAESRLAELATARKVFAELAPTATASQPAEPSTAYQAIVNAFNQHPDQEFRVQDLHELLGMPTDDPALNVTRNRLGRLTRQGFLTQPRRGLYRKGT